MSLFAKPTPTATPAQLQQLKTWVAGLLALDNSALISINQLRCHEPGCSPVETVIVVMLAPPQTYKIHKAATDIAYADLVTVLQSQGQRE